MRATTNTYIGTTTSGVEWVCYRESDTDAEYARRVATMREAFAVVCGRDAR